MKLKLRYSLLLLSFCILQFSGCTTQVLEPSVADIPPTSSTNYNRSPEGAERIDEQPPFLRWLAPGPSEVLTERQFSSTLLPMGTYDLPPPLPVSRTGYRLQICLWLDVAPLIEPGERMLELADIDDRVQLFVDDQEWAISLPEYHWEINYLPTVEYYDVDPAKYGEEPWRWHFNRDMPNDVAVYNELGFTLCWSDPVGPGIHEVEFRFLKMSQVVERYTWMFEILEGIEVASEPEPLPQELVTELPDFIFELRPEPGAFLTTSWFEADFGELRYEGPPAPSQAKVGLRSNVCALVNLQNMVEPGDKLFITPQVAERFTLSVNDQAAHLSPQSYLIEVDLPADVQTFGQPTDWRVFSSEPMPDSLALYVGDGTYLCWEPVVVTGWNSAELTFTRSSGGIETYAWKFFIVDD